VQNKLFYGDYMTLQEMFYSEKGYSCNYDRDSYISWLEKLVEEKFTSHNSAMQKLPPCADCGLNIICDPIVETGCFECIVARRQLQQ
jgi:hypothetical protein